MQPIGEIIEDKKLRAEYFKRVALNRNWEEAKSFCLYCRIEPSEENIKFVLMLRKRFGKNIVESLRTNLRDAHFSQNRIKGLLYYLCDKKSKPLFANL